MDGAKAIRDSKWFRPSDAELENVLADPVVQFAIEHLGARVNAIQHCSRTPGARTHPTATDDDGTANQELAKRMSIERRGQRLQMEIALVQAQIREIDVQCHQCFHYGNDIGDQANDLLERTRSMALCEHLENRLQQLNDALMRVARGSYGICAMCGKLIEPARLEAIPEAVLCVPCQQRREQNLAWHRSQLEEKYD